MAATWPARAAEVGHRPDGGHLGRHLLQAHPAGEVLGRGPGGDRRVRHQHLDDELAVEGPIFGAPDEADQEEGAHPGQDAGRR